MCNYRELLKEKKKDKKILLTKPRHEETDDYTLREFASLALRLRFESDQINILKLKCSDSKIAYKALLTARKPSRYIYNDYKFDSLVERVVNIFVLVTAVLVERPDIAIVTYNSYTSGNRYGFLDEIF